METPNFEIIANCIPNKGFFSQTVNRLILDWETTRHSNYYTDNEDLKNLLFQYGLENHYTDLLFIGNVVNLKYQLADQFAENNLKEQHAIVSELLGALSFLGESREKAKVKLYYQDEFLISQPELIEAIERGLKKYLKKNKKYLFNGFPNIEKQNSFDSFLSIRLDHLKERKNKIGGQTKPVSIKMMAYCAWNYLNNYTNLSTKPQFQISKRQIALFVYKYLRAFNYIKDLSTPEKTISDYYNYINNIIKHNDKKQ